MNFDWLLFVDMGIISLSLIVATFLRAKIYFFQKYLVPNSITAGLMLLLFYNLAAPGFAMTTDFLQNLVYHLLNISFVAMSLRTSKEARTNSRNAYVTSVGILSQYTIQGIIGLVLTFFFIKTFIPGLFPTFGFFIPLGFALGPGQSFAIGSKWEAPVYGFEGAGSVGLTFAAAGFFWAIFGGVFLINLALKRGWVKRPEVHARQKEVNNSGLYRKDDLLPVGAHLTTQSEAIETMSFNISIVLGVYFITFLFLKLLSFLLAFAGTMGENLAESFWGISFIFAADHILENGILTRTAGFSVDFMVAASIGAISIPVVVYYWGPILIMCILGGFATMITLLWIGSRLFNDYKFHRTILLYGALTGTLPSGLTLLRVVDPEYSTPVASDYIPAAGLTFLFAIPYVLVIDFPAYGFRDGNPLYYWLTAIFFAVYAAYILVAFVLLTRKKPRGRFKEIWKKE